MRYEVEVKIGQVTGRQEGERLDNINIYFLDVPYENIGVI